MPILQTGVWQTLKLLVTNFPLRWFDSAVHLAEAQPIRWVNMAKAAWFLCPAAQRNPAITCGRVAQCKLALFVSRVPGAGGWDCPGFG